MEIIKCKKGCCRLEKQLDPHDPGYNYEIHPKPKAGIFIQDPNTQKILLVQSRGRLWGPPKGTREEGETDIDCAIREVNEETNMKINYSELKKSIIIKQRSIYYFAEKAEEKVCMGDYISDNDVSGIGWVNLNCLEEFIQSDQIRLTHHCKILLLKFVNKFFN